MNLKTILTITTLCFAVITAQAQEKTRIGKYHLGVGLSIHSILDEGYAPMTFNGLNPNLTFSFQKDNNQNRIGFGLDAVYGKLKYEDFELFETDLIDVNLFALYARALDLGNEKTKFHLGGMIDYRILFLLNMPEEFTVGNVSYTVGLNLGLYVGLDYQLSDRDQLAINFKHPLFGNIVRNPYTGFNNTTVLLTDYGDNLAPLIFHNPEWTHGFKFFRPRLEIAWERQLSSNKIFVPKFSIEYLSYNSINPIKYFRTNFSIGINF